MTPKRPECSREEGDLGDLGRAADAQLLDASRFAAAHIESLDQSERDAHAHLVKGYVRVACVDIFNHREERAATTGSSMRHDDGCSSGVDCEAWLIS